MMGFLRWVYEEGARVVGIDRKYQLRKQTVEMMIGQELNATSPL
jgi:hypothetical protein